MSSQPRAAERGFMLVGLIVAIFLILLVLGVAAPRAARALRRDREVEALHRGNQYVRAIQLFYRKTGHYPGSLDQLEKTNNVRYLRQRYVDPMTGKPNWRLIHVGEAKTTVKGFFGQPLAGLPGAAGGLGAAAGMVSAGQPGSPTVGASGSGSGSSSSGFSLSSPGLSTQGATSSPSAAGNTSPATGAGALSSGSSTSSGSTGIGSQSATSFSGGGAPIVGISSVAQGSSILVLNEQTTYATWEFLYDPRIEQLKAKGSLLGGPATGTGTGTGLGTPPAGFGSPSAPSSGTGNGVNSTPSSSGAGPGTPGGSYTPVQP